MKKIRLEKLSFTKETISSLEANGIKGGTMNSGMCTSSKDPHECYFQCATAPADGC